MVITLIKIIFIVFYFINVACEVSNRYRDCKMHVAVRYAFMVASAIAYTKIGVLATAPLVVQISALIIVIFLAKFLYDHVLKRQIRIKNFRLKKLYLSESARKPSHKLNRR
ncbi:hypothetical protein BRC2024_KCUCJSVR_CDS_0130 [Acinetobacter phage vB_AbaM_KissB]